MKFIFFESVDESRNPQAVMTCFLYYWLSESQQSIDDIFEVSKDGKTVGQTFRLPVIMGAITPSYGAHDHR